MRCRRHPPRARPACARRRRACGCRADGGGRVERARHAAGDVALRLRATRARSGRSARWRARRPSTSSVRSKTPPPSSRAVSGELDRPAQMARRRAQADGRRAVVAELDREREEARPRLAARGARPGELAAHADPQRVGAVGVAPAPGRRRNRSAARRCSPAPAGSYSHSAAVPGLDHERRHRPRRPRRTDGRGRSVTSREIVVPAGASKRNRFGVRSVVAKSPPPRRRSRPATGTRPRLEEPAVGGRRRAPSAPARSEQPTRT